MTQQKETRRGALSIELMLVIGLPLLSIVFGVTAAVLAYTDGFHEVVAPAPQAVAAAPAKP